MYAVEQVRSRQTHDNFAIGIWKHPFKTSLGLQGLALPNRSPQIDGVLGALLAKLEKDKATVNCGPGDQQYCENFAVGVFNRADRVDRAGRADKNTSMTYYAASIFMEVR